MVSNLESIISFFVGNPERIIGMFAILSVMSFFVRSCSQVWVLVLSSVLWGLYAVWEGLIKNRNPEANIRIDLLLILPILLFLTILSLYAFYKCIFLN